MKLRFFHILVIILYSQLVFSAEKSNKDTFSIDEVYVTRVRPAERDISAASLQSVSSKELDLINGNTAADAIKNFSGVNIKDYGGIGGFKSVMVRSLGANHTGVFVDGIQLSDASTGQIDLGKINTENAESISLVIGQFPEMLQPARMYSAASVLNILAKDISRNKKPAELKAGVKTGSFGLINPSFSLQNKWTNRFTSGVDFAYSKADGMYPFKLILGNANEQTQYRRNSETEYMNLNTDLNYNIKDSVRLSCKIYLYNSSRGLPGAVVFYNPYSSQQLWNQDFFTNLRFENKKGRIQWLSNAKFSRNYLRYYDPTFLNSNGIIDNRYTQHEYYISQAAAFIFSGNLKFSVASDFIVNDLAANIDEYALPTRLASLSSLSVNWTAHRFESYATLLASFFNEKTGNKLAESAPSRKALSPAAGMSFLLLKNPSLRFRFFYKDIFRMPTFNDLYYTQIGNTKLEPERAMQYSAGFSIHTSLSIFDYLALKTEVYQNYVKDKIVAVPTKNLFVWSMRNIGKVDIKGIEFNMNVQTRAIAGIKYSLGLSYSYQQALDVSDAASSTYKQQIPYIPYENLSGPVSVSFRSFSMGWNTMFNGYRYVLGENIYDNLMPSWWLHDANVGYKFSFKEISLKMKFEINNLFDRQYEVVRSFPMPGRSFNFSLVFSN